MNSEKLTQKSMDAVRKAQSIAVMNSNQLILPVHLLAGLLKQENGLIPQLITKMNKDPELFEMETDKKIGTLPKVTGSGSANAGISSDLDRVITAAEQIAANMKDEFVSVEHLMLSLIACRDKDVSQLLDSFGISRDDFLNALMSVRGNTRVTSENPRILTTSSKSMVRSLSDLHAETNSTLLSVVTAKSETLSVFFHVRLKIIPFLSVNPVSVKRQLQRVLRSESLQATSPTASRTERFSPLIWVHLLQVQNTGASLKSD